MITKYLHSFHALNNSVNLLGVNQMCVISLGHLICSQTRRSSARGWCVAHAFGRDGAFREPTVIQGLVWVSACHSGVFFRIYTGASWAQMKDNR